MDNKPDYYLQKFVETEAKLGEAINFIRLVARSKRPDGTYNYCREALEQKAQDFLKKHTTTYDHKLVLTRNDLSPLRRLLPIEDIHYHDFKIAYKAFCQAAIVEFVDDDGTVKTLKNRHEQS